jgi:hypothetical protein
VAPTGTFALVLAAVVSAACAGSGGDKGATHPDAAHPDVVDVEVSQTGERTYRFDVTISSPYDSPQRYANAWRVLGPDGTVYGVRELLHHHAGEQPFTRSLTGVEVPAGVDTVTVQARDLVNGWGGAVIHVTLPPTDL